jgi:hypothetical protein
MFRRSSVTISKTAIAGPLAVALAIPAFAVAQNGPPDDTPPQPPAKAYGVICKRDGLTPGSTQFRACVHEHKQGVNGQKSAAAAARAICRLGDAPPRSPEFGKCVTSTQTLILGLRGLKAQ